MKHFISFTLFIALFVGVTYPFKDETPPPEPEKELHESPCSVFCCMCSKNK